MHEVVVYGIENCDQTRKARNWLRAHAIEHRFHDLRNEGLDASLLAGWLARVPWDSLLNRRGQAWRRLDAERRASVTDPSSAAELMRADPLLVKRPVLQAHERLLLGYSAELYANVFARGGGDESGERGERGDPDGRAGGAVRR